MLGLTKKTEVKGVDSIQQKSEAAIAVFKNTLDSLSGIQAEADLLIESCNRQIATIKDEIETLSIRKNTNEKFINKLKEFFE